MTWSMVKNTIYKISTTGLVVSTLTNKVLKHRISRYPMVQLGTRNCYVHRLVAEAFIPNPTSMPVVRHKDGNKLNCCVDNLTWGTYSDNMEDAIQSGVSNQGRRVNQYSNGIFVQEHRSLSAAAKAIGLAHPSNSGASNIKLCCDGLKKTAKGFTFKYAEDGD